MNLRSLFFILLGGVSLTGIIQLAFADVYANVTQKRSQVVKTAYFGTHFHRLVLNPGQIARTSWPDERVGSARLWDSGVLWAEVAPSAGRWNFERMDIYVAQAGMHDATVLYPLGGTPRWASARPDEPCPYGFGCAAESVKIAHWEEYVRRVVQRYRGRIGAYELWNEPYFSDIPQDRKATSAFYTGSVANMVEMARIARKVLDAEDPSAILLTPGFVGEIPNRLDMFLSAGGSQYVQAVAYHFYSANADQFMRQISDVRQVMERNGIGHLPLWNTETGVEVYPPGTPLPSGASRFTRDQAAEKLAQYLVLGAAAGLERFYHYAWDNGKSGMAGLHGELYPNLEVWRKVQDWLVGSRLTGCRKSDGNITVCTGERDAQTFAIVWADRGAEYSLRMKEGERFLGGDRLLEDIGDAASARGDHVHVRINQAPLLLRFAAPGVK